MNKKTKMLKIIAVIAIIACILPANARPNHFAQNGALDILYGPAGGQGILTLSFLHLAAGFSGGVYGDVYTAVGFAPLDFLEFSLGVTSHGYRVDDQDYLVGPIMICPGLKGGYPFYLGSEKNIFIAPGLSISGNLATASSWAADSTQIPDSGPAADFHGIIGMGTDKFKLNFNVGYGMEFGSDSSISTIPYGLAIQYSILPVLDALVEVSNRVPSGSIGSLDALVVTPVVRVSTAPITGFTFDLGVPIGVGSGADPWKIEIGASVAFDVMGRTRDPKAYLVGRVIDEEDGDPLRAVLTFPEHPEIASVLTDTTTGNFSAELTPGVYRVRAESDGYKWKEKGIILQDGDEKMLDFALAKAKEPRAQIAGTVRDGLSGEPVEEVTVSVSSTQISQMVTSDALGIFKIIVPPGSYQVSFAKQGYAVYQTSVTLYDKDIKELDISLKPPEEEKPEPITKPEFQNILFNPGSAVIKQVSYQALEEVLEFLKTHTNVRMEIQGHTDSVGNDDANMQLSQRRAEAVRSWLVDRGIDGTMLTSKGYGETKPVGDNRTRSGQEANRRIEFVLITE